MAISAASTLTLAEVCEVSEHPPILQTPPCCPAQPVASPLVFTHAFPGVNVSAGLADGNVLSSSVFIGCGEHGKTSRASSVLPDPVNPPPPLKPA